MFINYEQETEDFKTSRRRALKSKKIQDKKKGYYLKVKGGVNNLMKFIEIK